MTWAKQPDGAYIKGDLIVWRFKRWNVATVTTAPDGSAQPGNVLLMDCPTMRDACTLADAHAAGFVDLSSHASAETSARVSGSRTWGGYAPIYSHRWACSCGASGESENAADGLRERVQHIAYIAGLSL